MILAIITIVLCVTNSVKAADVSDYYNEVLEFDSEGNLIMTTHDKKATSGIRYKTLGWVIKKYPIGRHDEGNIAAYIPLEELMEAKTDPADSAYVYTYFYCDKQTVYEAIGRASKEWQQELYKNGGTVYLDAMDTVVENGILMGELIGNGELYSGEVYYTYEGIAYARDWASRESLLTHYDKQLTIPIISSLIPYEGTYEVMHKVMIDDNINNARSLSSLGYDRRGNLEKIEYDMGAVAIDEYTYVSGVAIYEDGTGTSQVYADSGGHIRFNNAEKLYTKVTVIFYYKYEEKIEKSEYSFNEDSSGKGLPQANAVIGEGIPQNSTFNVIDGVPVSESLYIDGDVIRCYGDYEVVEVSGQKFYDIDIRVHYKLIWTEEGNLKTEEVYNTSTQTVIRKYSYAYIDKLNLYYINKIRVENYALDNGYEEIDITEIPDIKYDKKSEYVTDPVYAHEVYIEGGVINGGDSRPDMPSFNYEAVADEKVGDIRVRNDLLCVNGKVILDDTETDVDSPDVSTPDMSDKEHFYTDGIVIDEDKRNGRDYESNGYAYYCKWNENSTYEYEIIGINSVTIHTPVVNNVSIIDDISYNQMVSPIRDRISLVLTRNVCFNIDNSGEHIDIRGYGDRDYAKYVKDNYVVFPFGIYKDDIYYRSGESIKIDGSSTFYLPAGVEEGNYTVRIYTLALNYTDDDNIAERANLDISEYGAYRDIEVCVMGRIYGFAIDDIVDYPRWQQVFRNNNVLKGTLYTVGLKNQNGDKVYADSRYTLPIVAGSNPYDNSYLKTGYKFRFRFDTVGSMAGSDDYIKIKPYFYYVSKSDGTAIPVDLYYNETIDNEFNYLVKVGSSQDNSNVKSMSMTDITSTVPRRELDVTVGIVNSSVERYYGNNTNTYTYNNIFLSYKNRTYIGDSERYNMDDIANTTSSIHRWYGEYSLPAKVYAVNKGVDLYSYISKNYSIDCSNDIFLRNGYIAVYFDITVVEDGVEHLSYINEDNYVNGYCNMWKTEGFCNTVVDNFSTRHNFADGCVILYDLDNNINDDYSIYGTH